MTKINEIKSGQTQKTVLTGYLQNFKRRTDADDDDSETSSSEDLDPESPKKVPVRPSILRMEPKDMDEAFKLFADKSYNEVDGIYIVFMGQVDVISPVYRKGTCVFQLNLFD